MRVDQEADLQLPPLAPRLCCEAERSWNLPLSFQTQAQERTQSFSEAAEKSFMDRRRKIPAHGRLRRLGCTHASFAPGVTQPTSSCACNGFNVITTAGTPTEVTSGLKQVSAEHGLELTGTAAHYANV